jgi:hypothetical protein
MKRFLLPFFLLLCLIPQGAWGVTSITVATDAYVGTVSTGVNANVSNFNVSQIEQGPVTYNGKQYIAYVNSNLQVAFVVRNLTTNIVSGPYVVPGSTFVAGPNPPDSNPAWDVHRSVNFGFDKNGYIHISYGHHFTPLRYRKSTNPEDVTAWSAEISMTGGPEENAATYPFFLRSPVTDELYFFFRGTGCYLLYHYNATSGLWEAATGTSATGKFVADEPIYFNAPPQWDSSGNLWFSATPRVGDTIYENIYVFKWTGTSFVNYDTTALVIPGNHSSYFFTLSDFTSAITVHDTLGQNRMWIDGSDKIFIPYIGEDGSNIMQLFVAENSTGSFVAHQLTSNTFQSGAGVGGYTKNLRAGGFSYGGRDYVVVSDQFYGNGTCPGSADVHCGMLAMWSSTDKFVTSSKSYIVARNNPNAVLLFDPDRLALGKLSFKYQDANDCQYGYVYFDPANPAPPYDASLQKLMVYDFEVDDAYYCISSSGAKTTGANTIGDSGTACYADIATIFSANTVLQDDTIEYQADVPGGSTTFTPANAIVPGADDGGATGHNVGIQGRAGDTITIDMGGGSKYAFDFNSRNYFTLKDLIVRNNGTYALVEIRGTSVGIDLQNVILNTNTGSGIEIATTAATTITGPVTITGCNYGLSLVSSGTSVLNAISISNSAIAHIVAGTAAGTYTINDSTLSGTSPKILSVTYDGMTINLNRNSISAATPSNGGAIYNTSTSTVNLNYNKLIQTVTGWSFLLYQLTGAGTINANNCVFYGDNTLNQKIAYSTAGVINIKNSIGYSFKRGFVVGGTGSIVVDYGIHYLVTVVNEAGATITNSSTADPLFVNPGTNFHLLPGSPAINAGTVVVGLHDQAGCVDYAGTTCYNVTYPYPDIGAYAYTAKPILITGTGPAFTLGAGAGIQGP